MDAPVPRSASISAAGPPVLVVDDEPHIGRIIRTRLEQDGLTVILAEDGPAALAALAAHPTVGVLVLDLMLPGLSGNEVLRRVRADARWAQLPCIVLTAAGQESQLRDVEALGASEVMTKPFSPRRLLARVRHYLASVDGSPASTIPAPSENLSS
ncbi:MAG: response regulator [Gemmatimonadetes bacterium]|nr:response regulator [Gemmatimonadota bacterium]